MELMLGAVGRYFKLKNRASGDTSRRPDPTIVALDDRLTDREAHSHATGFGREQRFENATEVVWVNSAPGILD